MNISLLSSIRRKLVNIIIAELEANPYLARRLSDALPSLPPESEPRTFDKVIKDTIGLKIDAKTEVTIFECNQPATFWGFLNFAQARPGDEFRLQLYAKVGNEFAPYEAFVIEGQQHLPIKTLPKRFTPAIRCTLQQRAGLGKPIPFEFYVKYAS